MKYVDKLAVKNDTYEIHDTAARNLITETGNQVGELQADVQLLDAQMDLALSGITSLRDEVTTIENKQVVDEANIYQNTTDIANIKPRVSAVEAVSTQNQVDITNLKSRMTSAENTLSTINDNISVINAVNEQQTSDINVNKNDIASLKSRMSTAESDISDIRTDIDDLDDRITASTYEAGIGIYFGKGEEHTNINIEDELIDKINEAGTLADRVTAVENNVHTINNNITTINNNITTINGDIDNINGDIDNINGDIDNINGDIDDIGDEIDDIWDAIHGGGGGGGGTTIYSNIPGNEDFNPAKLGNTYIQDSVFRKSTRNIPTGPSTTASGTYVTLREFAIYASGSEWSKGGSLNGNQLGMQPADIVDNVFNTYIDNTPGVVVSETKNEHIKKRDFESNPGLIYMDLITNTGEHRKIPMSTCNTVPTTLQDPFGVYDSIPSFIYFVDFLDAENKTIYRYEYRAIFEINSYNMILSFYRVYQIPIGGDAALEDRVTACETNITEIQGNIAVIEGDIRLWSSHITDAEDDISALQEDMTTAQSDITTLQDDVSTLQDKTNIRYVNFTSTSTNPYVLTTSATAPELTAILSDFKAGYQVRGIIDGPVSTNYNAPVMIMTAGDRGSGNTGAMIFGCEEFYDNTDNLQYTVVVTWGTQGVQVDTKLIRPIHKSFELISQVGAFESLGIRSAEEAEELYQTASSQNYNDRYFNVFSVLVILGFNYQWATAQVTYNSSNKKVTAVVPVEFMTGTSRWGTVVMTIDQSYNVTYEYRREDRKYDDTHTSETSHVALYDSSTSSITDLDNAPVGIYRVNTYNNPANMPSDITVSSGHYIYVETYAPKDSNSGTVGVVNKIQKCYDLSTAGIGVFYQRMKVGTTAWSSWYKFTGTVVT